MARPGFVAYLFVVQCTTAVLCRCFYIRFVLPLIEAHPDYGDSRPIFAFADGVARTIQSCYINSTCYFLSVAAKGNALAPALEEGQDVLIHATGYDAAGKETGTVTMTFASKDKLIKEWTKWDLSSLGKVAKVRFNMTGGPDNGYGFSMPAYYALDDITIEL